MAEFSKADVTVTLTGAEWFSILARLDYAIRGDKASALSESGMATYRKGIESLQAQLKRSAGIAA